MKRILVWDLPTRIFHWLLVVSFIGAWITSSSDRWLSIHIFLGYLVLGLIIFRLVWGWVGGHYARFASFVVGPKAALKYLRDLLARRDAPFLGHNPAASVAILAMLLLGIAVSVTGIFTEGGEERHGPLMGLVSIGISAWMKDVHEALAIAMVIVVVGHLIGVAVGSWLHNENLPLTMVTGIKQADDDALPSKQFRGVGVLLVLAIAAFGAWWFYYAWHEPLNALVSPTRAAPPARHVAFVGAALADDPLWRSECGSCHLAYHPNLLPARSWKLIMAEQSQHFGTDLAIEPATSATILAFLIANAAERNATEAAGKINRSLPADVTPRRITEAPYWVAKHEDIPASDWKLPAVKSKGNCAACHLDAEAGTFEDAAMKIPR